MLLLQVEKLCNSFLVLVPFLPQNVKPLGCGNLHRLFASVLAEAANKTWAALRLQ